MNCLKCGNQIPDTQIFCDSCLQEMEKYPVAPDTPVQLPEQSSKEVSRRPAKRRRRVLEPEEKISRQKKVIQALSWVIAVLVLAAGIFAGLVCWKIHKMNEKKPDIGQNYVAEESTT